MIVSCAQMKAAEEALFATGVEAEGLMDEAGAKCAQAILQTVPGPAQARVYVGKGHNGGDALVVGHHLRKAGWTVDLHLVSEPEKLADLTQKKLQAFEQTPDSALDRRNGSNVILIDGLLGIGAKGGLNGIYREFAEAMNDARQRRGALCFAVDIPSGLNGDTGEPYDGAVIADYTLAIAYVKAGLVADHALDHVGRLMRIPLPSIPDPEGDSAFTTLHAAGLIPRLARPRFSQHKGQAGRVGIVAGSRGYVGAAELVSLGALRAGAGLVTLFVHEDIYAIVASRVPAEIMVMPVSELAEVAAVNVDALAIGPGIGRTRDSEVLTVLLRNPAPMVIDADALNLLAQHPAVLAEIVQEGSPKLLTPHPGEFQRLFPEAHALPTRLGQIQAFRERYPVALVYKGARSFIAAPGYPVAANTTGTPGMATGGIGDVLTGITATLLAHGHHPYDAGCLGSWLIGRAGELASAADGYRAPESLSATEIVANLRGAFASLRRGDL